MSILLGFTQTNETSSKFKKIKMSMIHSSQKKILLLPLDKHFWVLHNAVLG